MQGMKIALFDVSDVANPKQKFMETIGDRGTDSELLRNHKALLFDKEKSLLAFPIRIQEKITPDKTIQRILYIGEYLYTISQGMVKGNEMENLDEVKAVEIK